MLRMRRRSAAPRDAPRGRPVAPLMRSLRMPQCSQFGRRAGRLTEKTPPAEPNALGSALFSRAQLNAALVSRSRVERRPQKRTFQRQNLRLTFAELRANIGEIAEGDAYIKAGIRADEAIYAFFLEISPTSSNRDEIPHPF